MGGTGCEEGIVIPKQQRHPFTSTLQTIEQDAPVDIDGGMEV